MGNDVSVPQSHLSRSRVVQHAHNALFEYDFLSMIFDVFDLEDKADRATCARSARVCRAWTEPASRALWSRTRWKLLDLCTVLLKHSTPSGTRGFKRMQVKGGKLRRNSLQRESFLRCAARVRQLAVTQRWLPSPLEVQLVRRVLSMSDGTTLLPALLSLSWVEGPRTNGLLLRLIPPSLQELELILDWAASPEQVHPLLTGLSHPVLSLRNIRIYAGKPELFLLDPLLGVTSIRDLSLKGGIAICPEQLCKIFSCLSLVSLEVTVRDFGTWAEVINGGNLKELHCAGTCGDLTFLMTHLRCQNLNTVDLQLNIVDARFDPTAHHHLSETLLKFSPTLRSLQLDYRRVYTSLSSATHLPAMHLVSDVLKPLLNRLDLESFTLCSGVPVLLTDDQILRLAQGWPMLRSLSLVNHPCEPINTPTPTALVHLAKSCPNLRFLRIQLNAYNFHPLPAEPSLELRALRHPLRTLRPMNECDAPRGGVAELLDDLFPHLAVETCEEAGARSNYGRGREWATIWSDVRVYQVARRAGRDPHDRSEGVRDH